MIGAIKDPEGRSLKSQMKKADKLGARFVVLLGDDEPARDVFMVRSMSDSQQQEMPVGGLLGYLKEKIHG